MKRDTFGPILTQLIQHESGLYYTYYGRSPHVDVQHAMRFSAGSAQHIVDIINGAGRGRYAVVEVQS